MFTRRAVCPFAFTFVFLTPSFAQDPAAAPAPAPTPVAAAEPPAEAAPPVTFALTVPKGTPLQVALDREVRIQKVGQPIHGRVVQPVYAFDRLVVPVGSEVTGHIAKIERIPGKQRTLSVLNANFTPAHKIEVEFTDLLLAEGKSLALHTVVTPGSGQVMQLVTAGENDKKKRAKQVVSEKMKEARQEAKRDWDNAMKQVKEPGKMHRLTKYAVAQLPAHPQYIDAGTLYFAELQEPLDFGFESISAKAASTIGMPPPPGSLVHALLVTPLNSASTQKGEAVEAVLSQPLFDGERLLLPQGSRLKGSVLQVQPARRMARNGELRIVFHELIPPDGVAQKVDASLEGLEAGQAEHVHLDSEGGAQATTPKTRYLSTALSVALAAASTSGLDGHHRRGDVDADSGDAGGRAAGGATGFKLVGIVIGAAVHSQPLGFAMGAYGASQTVYSHFFARGRDVIFPKNTIMEIGFGARSAPPPKPQDSNAVKQ